jgi:hypothetical protein
MGGVGRRGWRTHGASLFRAAFMRPFLLRSHRPRVKECDAFLGVSNTSRRVQEPNPTRCATQASQHSPFLSRGRGMI